MRYSLKKLNIKKFIVVFVLIIIPFILIYAASVYLGYFEDSTFVNPCTSNVEKEKCTNIKGCEWYNDTKKCVMDSKCTSIHSQQNCAEGCTWDPHIKRYNSNIYGLCRPDFRLSKEEVGENTELRA